MISLRKIRRCPYAQYIIPILSEHASADVEVGDVELGVQCDLGVCSGVDNGVGVGVDDYDVDIEVGFVSPNSENNSFFYYYYVAHR